MFSHKQSVNSAFRFQLYQIPAFFYLTTMEKNYAFVDFQGFKSNTNKFIVKEFAITTKNVQFHDIIKSPYTLHHLDIQHQRQVHWLTKNHHGLDWSNGFITLNELRRTIEPILHNKIAYVKGGEKTKWLKQILGNKRNICEIIDIDSDECPLNFEKQDVINYYRKFHTCHKHKLIKKMQARNCHCALVNTLVLRNWFSNQSKEKKIKYVYF